MTSSRDLRRPDAEDRHGRLRRAPAFGVCVAVFCLLIFASAAPSPLYRVYQQQWGFSAPILTAVFAIYSITLLITLLFLGSLSDHLGRRAVIFAALVVDAGGCVAFLAANSVGLLVLGRALQGIAVGSATAALGAALIDLQPQGSQFGAIAASAASTTGLAAGAIVTSLLVQYGPAPTQLIWWVLLGAFGVAAIAVLALPETSARRSGVLASLRPRIGVPRSARPAFLSALPSLVAMWSLGGFYLSLGPSLMAQLSGSDNLLWGGAALLLFNGAAGAAAVGLRAWATSLAVWAGSLLLLAGTSVSIAGLVTSSAVLFLLGVTAAGAGFGLAFLGEVRVLTGRARSGERAGIIAAIYIVAYLAVSIPAVAAGLATPHYGLHRTALVYSILATVLAAVAAADSAPRHGARQEV